MTEGQIKYQTLMETQRHNLAMEQLGSEENIIKSRQAKVAETQADIALYRAPAQNAQDITKSMSNLGSTFSNVFKGVVSAASLFI